jgi:hypothetical protein
VIWIHCAAEMSRASPLPNFVCRSGETIRPTFSWTRCVCVFVVVRLHAAIRLTRTHAGRGCRVQVVAVMAQVLAWFVLVHFVEFGINAYYYDKTANASTFPWCADFSFAFNAGSAFVAIQKLFDMFA